MRRASANECGDKHGYSALSALCAVFRWQPLTMRREEAMHAPGHAMRRRQSRREAFCSKGLGTNPGGCRDTRSALSYARMNSPARTGAPKPRYNSPSAAIQKWIGTASAGPLSVWCTTIPWARSSTSSGPSPSEAIELPGAGVGPSTSTLFIGGARRTITAAAAAAYKLRRSASRCRVPALLDTLNRGGGR